MWPGSEDVLGKGIQVWRESFNIEVSERASDIHIDMELWPSCYKFRESFNLRAGVIDKGRRKKNTPRQWGPCSHGPRNRFWRYRNQPALYVKNRFGSCGRQAGARG